MTFCQNQKTFKETEELALKQSSRNIVRAEEILSHKTLGGILTGLENINNATLKKGNVSELVPFFYNIDGSAGLVGSMVDLIQKNKYDLNSIKEELLKMGVDLDKIDSADITKFGVNNELIKFMRGEPYNIDNKNILSLLGKQENGVLPTYLAYKTAAMMVGVSDVAESLVSRVSKLNPKFENADDLVKFQEIKESMIKNGRDSIKTLLGKEKIEGILKSVTNGDFLTMSDELGLQIGDKDNFLLVFGNNDAGFKLSGSDYDVLREVLTNRGIDERYSEFRKIMGTLGGFVKLWNKIAPQYNTLFSSLVGYNIDTSVAKLGLLDYGDKYDSFIINGLNKPLSAQNTRTRINNYIDDTEMTYLDMISKKVVNTGSNTYSLHDFALRNITKVLDPNKGAGKYITRINSGYQDIADVAFRPALERSATHIAGQKVFGSMAGFETWHNSATYNMRKYLAEGNLDMYQNVKFDFDAKMQLFEMEYTYKIQELAGFYDNMLYSVRTKKGGMGKFLAVWDTFYGFMGGWGAGKLRATKRILDRAFVETFARAKANGGIDSSLMSRYWDELSKEDMSDLVSLVAQMSIGGKYYNRVNRYLNEDEEKDNTVVEDVLGFIEDMGMFNSTFQAMQSNASSRMFLKAVDSIDEYMSGNKPGDFLAYSMIRNISDESLGQLRGIKLFADLMKGESGSDSDSYLGRVFDSYTQKAFRSYMIRGFQNSFDSAGEGEFTKGQLAYYLTSANSPMQKAISDNKAWEKYIQEDFEQSGGGLLYAYAYIDGLATKFSYITRIGDYLGDGGTQRGVNNMLFDTLGKDYYKSIVDGEYENLMNIVSSLKDGDIKKKGLVSIIDKQLLVAYNEEKQEWTSSIKGTKSDQTLMQGTLEDFVLGENTDQDISVINRFKETNPMLVDKYGNINMEEIDKMYLRGKTDFADFLRTSMKDPTKEVGGIVSLGGLYKTMLNSFVKGRYVFDQNGGISTEEKEIAKWMNVVSNKYGVGSNEYNEQYATFFTKKGKLKETSGEIKNVYWDNGELIQKSGKDVIFQSQMKEGVQKLIFPFLKEANMESVGPLLSTVQYWVESEKGNQIVKDMYRENVNDKGQVDYSKPVYMSKKIAQSLGREVKLYEDMKNGNTDAVLAYNDWFSGAQLYVPRDTNGELETKDWTQYQRDNFNLKNLLLAQNTIETITNLPGVNSYVKVAALAGMYQKGGYGILQAAQKLDEEGKLPEQAKAMLEWTKRKIFSALPDIYDIGRDFIQSEAERLSGIGPESKGKGGGGRGGKGGGGGKGKVPSIDLLTALADDIKEIKFKDITLPNVPERKPMRFNATELSSVRKGVWSPAISKAYSPRTSSTSSKTKYGNIVYGRGTANRSKKKGLKSISFT